MNNAGFHVNTEHVIREGMLDEFKKRVSQAVRQLEAAEPRTRSYISYISADGRRCQFDQYFEDLDAFLEHLKNEGPKLAELLEGVSDFYRTWLYTDEDSPELRAAIDSFGTTAGVVTGPAFVGFRRDDESPPRKNSRDGEIP